MELLNLPRLNRMLCLFPVIAAAFSAGAQATVAQRLAAAQKAEQARDYATASREYEQILKLQPTLPLIHQSLAVTYHLQNRYLEAISEFQNALRLDSTLWGADLFLGMDLYKSNRFKQALAPLEKSIQLNAKMAEPEARFWLAVTYMALDKPDAAITEWRRDLELRPQDIDVLYYVAKAYDGAAAAAFEKLGRLEPRAAAVFLLQAERSLDEHRNDIARLEFQMAVHLRPDFAGWIPEFADEKPGPKPPADLAISTFDARSNLELALLYASAGDSKEAAVVLRNLVSQTAADSEGAKVIADAKEKLTNGDTASVSATRGQPSDALQGVSLLLQRHFREAETPLAHAQGKELIPGLRRLLVRAYVEAGDYTLAENSLRPLLVRDPDDLDALHLLGKTYKGQAEMTLRQMIAIDADSFGVHELLGKQHEERTEYDMAIQEYQVALAKRPEFAGIRYAIGNVYRKANRYDEAEQWLSGELERNPYHGLAHYRLGGIYLDQGKARAAIPHLEGAVRSHPNLLDAQLDLGRAYTADGRYVDAITTLKKVALDDTQNDRVHYLLSAAYAKQGRRDLAQTELSLYQRLTRTRLERTQQDVRSLSESLDRH